MTDPAMVAACLAPIKGASPAGRDTRFDTEYGTILSEIEKLSFPGGGVPTSWRTVEDMAMSLLGNTTKDIQLASYLGVALLHNHGLAGMQPGIAILAAMLRDYWDTAFPPPRRVRGRINALDWWHERCRLFLDDAATSGTTLEPDSMAETMGSLEELEALAAARMPDAAPLSDITSLLRRLASPAAAPPAAQAPDPAPQASPAPSAGPARSQDAIPQSPAPEADPAPNPTALRNRFLDISRAYLAQARRTDGRNPAPWRLLRLIMWSGVTELPSAIDGVTQVPVPDAAPLAEAMRLLANGASLEAALTAEDAFATAPFLLDCQRAVHGALAALGPEYAEAAEAVRQETTLLVQRLPGLETLRFSDGTPFATQETAAWLRIPAPRPSPSPPGSVSPPQEDPAGDHVAAARLLAGNGRLAAALRELEMARSPSRAANLRLDTIALEMLIRAGEGESALTLAQSIAENTAAHKLDDWDPEQAILALGPVREALLRFAPEGRKELAEVNRRIAGIMPSSLLR